MSLFKDDSNRDSESLYADSIYKDYNDSDIATPSPIQESSQDEYTVTSTKNEFSSIIYSTPTSHSGCTERCSPKTCFEFQKMCKNIYIRVTSVLSCRKMTGLRWHISFHLQPKAVRYAVPWPMRSTSLIFLQLKLYKYCLSLEYKNLHVNSQSNLFDHMIHHDILCEIVILTLVYSLPHLACTFW